MCALNAQYNYYDNEQQQRYYAALSNQNVVDALLHGTKDINDLPYVKHKYCFQP